MYKRKVIFSILFLLIATTILPSLQQKTSGKKETGQEKLLPAIHSISSHALLEYVKELCKPEYGGRLTGTKGYNASADWVAGLLKEWSIKPAGDNNTYLQAFANPYTRVLPGSALCLHIPVKKGQFIKKHYQYEKDFIPGSTSDSGEVTAEVIYVGYGITAPELNYDEYRGLNVKGKIVLMEREVPVSPDKESKEFKKWRKYSFHQYKVQNAKAHGAAGMLYNYHIANPNCLFLKGLVLTYVGQSVVNDLFRGTGYNHEKTVKQIKKKRRPKSFKTKKTVTIKNVTRHYPDGMAYNVIGMIPGTDAELKKEAIILAGHLDHVGMNHKLMPGANDNASAVAVILEVSRAITQYRLTPKRSIILIFFGAEEQGVKGSEFYLKHPVVPNNKVKAFINMDGVGRGDKLVALAGKNYPELWQVFDQVNKKYIHRTIRATHFHNRARPRLDAAHFMWANIPTISFAAFGGEKLPFSPYHKTTDTPDIITPEIMEDLAQLILTAILDLANQ